MDAADRRLAVSWSIVEGATGYKIAARLKNGVEPFPWMEYDAESPPYAVTDGWAAMSGREYEVRAASVNADGQSVWSPPVAVTAPELRPAPPNAIQIGSDGPYVVGDRMRVGVGDQRPFARRSLFLWSVCGPDGSECELLPLVSSPTYIYLAGESARGKRVQVQVDYDKDGASFTATAALGVVSADAPSRFTTPPTPALPPGCEEAEPPSGEDVFETGDPLATHLHHLESKSAPLEWDAGRGGAVEPLCNDLLVVTPWGGILLVRANGDVERIEGQVPMGLEQLRAHPDSATFSDTFRVADILLKQHSEEQWELFVTHHYFTGDCIRFRLSSAAISWERGNVSVSPTWRTLFDAEPCLPPSGYSGLHAGGRMLTDGPDHLLVVVGDQGRLEAPQNPDSHLGKLVRIAIEAGEAEILAFGIRNPQGFARDADGNLWETEHGPQGGDELNLLEPGANYGYPSVSYGVQYGGFINVPEDKAASVGKHEAFALPRFAWIPSIAISAVAVNDERWFPLWEDDLLIGSLGGGYGNSLFRVRRVGTDIQYVERIKVGYRIRDLTQMPDGRIALLADGGRVHFLARSEEYCDERSRRILLVYSVGCGPIPANAAPEDDAPSDDAPNPGGGAEPDPADGGDGDADADAAAGGEQLYATHCAACHSLNIEEHGIGPHLVGVIGRSVGQVEGWNLSEALRSLSGVWTRESLAQFLADPQGFAPGTTMGSQGLSESEAGAIADYVAGLPARE